MRELITCRKLGLVTPKEALRHYRPEDDEDCGACYICSKEYDKNKEAAGGLDV